MESLFALIVIYFIAQGMYHAVCMIVDAIKGHKNFGYAELYTSTAKYTGFAFSAAFVLSSLEYIF